MTPALEASLAKIGRKRDRDFVCRLIEEIGKNGGVVTDQVLLDAAEQVWVPAHKHHGEVGKKRLVEKAKAKLKIPDIREGVQQFFEVATGFDVLEAAELHVKHIRGEFTQQKVTKDGEVVDVAIPPNYAALKDFQNMTLPQPAKKLDIRAAIGHAEIRRDESPQIAARTIGVLGPILDVQADG